MPLTNLENTPLLCQRCPYPNECKSGEQPGSAHCFAVLQRLNPLTAEEIGVTASSNTTEIKAD